MGPDHGRLTAAAPDPGRGYAEDSRKLAAFLARIQEALEALPPRRDRDAEQERTAAAVHTAARRARRRFIEIHAERVYSDLTDGRRAFLRLADLAGHAAELLPGLVPAEKQLADERALAQGAKEGWETDQAIFFWGLLRGAATGLHISESMRRPAPQTPAALAAFRATGHADLDIVSVRRNGEVGEVTVNNARVLNAEDDALVAALEVAVDLVLLDDAIRVGVLRGAAMTHPRWAGRRVFSAGINLTALYHGSISLIDFFLNRELGYINKIFRGLSVPDSADTWLAEPIEKPWVGVVDSFAIGGGAQVLLLFDRVLAADGSYFSLPALREGIVPGAANLRMPRIVGNRLSRQSIYADRRIDATSPEGRLLCDEVVAEEHLDQAAAAAAAELANPATINNRRLQHQFEEPEDVFCAYVASYAVEQVRRLYSRDLVANLERTWIARGR